VCENPKNPVFNHYMFEAVALLIKRACEQDPSLISSFETSLLPSLQMILSTDVREFFPYAFQLPAELVDLNGSPIPGNYMEIFAILLLPESCKKSGNVPALVRLLQAFLRKAPHELNQQGRLSSVLGIFNTLVSSPSTDEQGFYVLNTVIENLGYDVISSYISHIWVALFKRLQYNKTVKFIKSLVVFMSLIFVKHGPEKLATTMNAVQPDHSYTSSRPEEDRVEEDPEVPDFGETVGCSATFVHLYNAGRKEEDPVRDISDPKQFWLHLWQTFLLVHLEYTRESLMKMLNQQIKLHYFNFAAPII
ncbi:Exportin-2, partial [Sesamum angolense]